MLHLVVTPHPGEKLNSGKDKMNNMLLKLYVKFQELKNREEGQDLVEYAMVVALIAFGATAGMKALSAESTPRSATSPPLSLTS